MDGEVPEYLAGGVSRDRDGSLRALDDYYLTHELLELLHHHGNAGSAGSSQQHGSFVVDEKPSLKLPAKEVAGEAEMASWLCQIFEQEASNPPITATTMTEGETTMRGSSGGGAASGHCRAASNSGTPADERPRSSSSRRRSGSGKAAEQRPRDKINDKMRTLQQLMPRCSKRDKASTLEEVIQYVKLLQHQLQVLSASGYAMPIVPPGAAPPSCMQRAAGDALGEPAPGPAPVILPPYPFVPAAVFACPYHGHSTPPPQQQQHCYPGGSGSATQQLAHGRRLASSDLAVPSHR